MKLFKVWLSPSQKCFVSFESPLKKMKNAFYFIIKTLFVLQIFKFLSWLFGNVEKIAWFPANMYLFKLNKKNTIEKLWNMFINVFLVFYCSRWAYLHFFLVFLLVTLNKEMLAWKIHFKIYDVTTWLTNNYNRRIA